MKKKFFKRAAATALACMMVAQSASGMIVASAETQSQVASDKEVVYVNSYGTSSREQNFDDNWKFYLGDASGAEANGYDDSAWDTVNLPHDYSIEQEYTKSGEAESAYLLGGTGWYRKHFTVSPDMEGKEVRIDFGGVYMNSTVWVNGTKVGTHPYGYTSFSFDISDYLNYSGENIITVKVEHKTPSSRFYSGSGIYRSVNLTVMDKVHVDLYGTNITTPNLEEEQGGTVNMTVKTSVVNEEAAAKDVVLTHTIYEKGTENTIGTVTTNAQSVAAGETAEITATLPAKNPALWDITDPNLYTVVTEVKVGGDVVDTYETEYGFRYFKFDNNTGFYLNGEAVKLKGVCMHHDQGSLGAEAYQRAIERQVELLKAMGCNAIRVTHNPAADELIEACNEIGVLVIDEAFDGWIEVKNGNSYDYSNWFEVEIGEDNEILGGEADMTWAEFDAKAMVKRGMNSPAVIMWSIGNEVQEGTYWTRINEYPQVAADIISWIQEVDTSRPVTNGDNTIKNFTSQLVSVDTNIYNAGGVVGGNYCSGSQYDAIHNRFPDWPIYGSETASHVNSRGVYDYIGNSSQTYDKELTAYDYSAVGWGATASSAWYDVITRDFVAGEFVWTGFDYLGEPTPWNGTGTGAVGSWPSPKNSFFGIIDTAGLPKDNYYFYQSQWNDDVNTLHVLPAWNEDVVNTSNAGKVPVVVYSDAKSVQLTFTDTEGNVTDLGTKTFTEKTTEAGYTYQIYEGSDKESTTNKNLYLTWYVPYEDGTITAIGYDADGNVIEDTVGRSSVTTTGDEAALELTADAETIDADGKDLVYVTIDVVDEDGNIVPDAANQVTVKVDGAGTLVGMDNGKQADHQSYQDDNRAAYNGSLVAIVQSTKEAGEMTITASASGLTSASVKVTTESTGASADVGFYMSKNYYVQVGQAPVLPETIEARYADGTSEDLPVVWAEISEDSYAQAGSFSVAGTVDDKYSVAVTINVIDEVGGLLNYSTTTTVGTVPSLPAARPVVLVDGTILEATFPVAWEAVTADDFAEEGIVVVEGKGDVLGTKVDVTASVRVQEEIAQVGDNFAPMALTLTQDIAEELQSDTLSAIIDGSTAIDANNDGGANESAWTNYDNSQAGDNTAEIVFEYATQQSLGEVVIHFFRDGYSAEYPDAGTTEIQVSEDGTNWTKVEATETMGEESGNVKAYTYSFNPVKATFVKLCLTNSTAQKTVAACTGITEVELNGSVGGGFTVNTAAGFETLTVNGIAPTEQDLAEGVMYCSATEVVVMAEGKDNAAVTVLPAYDGKVVIITESEDHAVRETFTILLGQERPTDPTDDSKDYPLTKITYTTGSEQPASGNEGPVSYAFDGNVDTFWHSEWSPSWPAADFEKYLWVDMELAEATVVDGIRFLPRGGNGDITGYRIEGSADGGETYTTLTEGTFERNGEWQVAKFTATELTNVRLVATATYADSGNNKFASAREIRVLKAGSDCTHPNTEITSKIEATCTKDGYTGNETCTECGAIVKAGTVVKATGHAWGEWEVVKEPTTEEAGLKERVCANCNDTEKEEIEKLPQTNPFTDVAETDWYYKAVLWGAENKVVAGLAEDKFGPAESCTRAQIVAFIWRAEGRPEPETTECPFTDISESDWYYKAVLWATENGIVFGYTKDTFAPDGKCTRAEMATFIWRLEDQAAPAGTENPFIDVVDGQWYTTAAQWTYENGIVSGYDKPEGKAFAPENTIARAETVTMLYRYYNK